MAERVTQETASGLLPGMRVLFRGEPHRITSRVFQTARGGREAPYLDLECLRQAAAGCGPGGHVVVGWWRLELP